MKNIFNTWITYCAILLVFTFTSNCKQSDVTTGTNPDDKIGTWTMRSFELSPSDNGLTNLKEYYNNRISNSGNNYATNCYGDIRYNFGSNGIVNLTYPSSSCVTGSTFNFFSQGDRWSIKESQLIIDSDKRRVYNIVSSSNNNMQLSYQSTNPINGVTSTYTAVFYK